MLRVGAQASHQAMLLLPLPAACCKGFRRAPPSRAPFWVQACHMHQLHPPRGQAMPVPRAFPETEVACSVEPHPAHSMPSMVAAWGGREGVFLLALLGNSSGRPRHSLRTILVLGQRRAQGRQGMGASIRIQHPGYSRGGLCEVLQAGRERAPERGGGGAHSSQRLAAVWLWAKSAAVGTLRTARIGR